MHILLKCVLALGQNQVKYGSDIKNTLAPHLTHPYFRYLCLSPVAALGLAHAEAIPVLDRNH